MGIPDRKIEFLDTYGDSFGYNEQTDPRVRWLRELAENHIENTANRISGDVAECGVCRGKFARYINKYFPGRTLYLFDTFDGFSDQDIALERSLGNASFNKSMFSLDESLFTRVSAESVIKHMPSPEKCVIRKGYFPETAADLPDTFAFVNLDMDLYKPTLEALKVFWGKMARGGCVLLHDYYHPELPGIAKAVADYEMLIEQYICKAPIGDNCSVALLKN
jgi:hypothetical protein